MENAKESCPPPSPKPASGETRDPSPNPPPADAAATAAEPAAPRRTPFTSLSQVDADFALARALQEQERAYMMLQRNGDGGVLVSGYGSSEDDYEEYDEGEEDEYEEEEEGEEEYDGAEHDHLEADGSDYGEEEEEEVADEEGDDDREIDPANFDSDEAYAQAVQEAEGRSIAAQLMALAGLGGWVREERDEQVNDAQDAWEDVDPDEYSYEELIALGDIVGTQNRGLSADTIPSLSSINYKADNAQKDGNTEQCVICRSDYEDGESLVVLSCKHIYHSECISKWLQINKVCPVCNSEVSTSENKQE